MYRKELRHIKEMEDQRQALTRVSNYPVVRDTWHKMSEVYQRGKEGSRLLRFCGGVAESSASLAYRASQPMIEKLPVQLVNDYAVTKLVVLEERYPVIAKPTEEMVDVVKTYSSSKLEEAKTYSTSQFNRFVEVTRLDALIGVVDTVVDTVLPPVPSKDAGPPSAGPPATPAPPKEPLTRMRMLSEKVRRRAYDNAMSKAGGLKTRSEETIAQLVHTVDLIKFAQRLGTFDDAKKKMVSVYGEVMAERDIEEEEEVLAPNASFEKRVILVARGINRRIQSSIVTIRRMASDIRLPANTRVMITNACNFAETFYTEYILKLVQHYSSELDQLRFRAFNFRTRSPLRRLVHMSSESPLPPTDEDDDSPTTDFLAPSAVAVDAEGSAPATSRLSGDSLVNSTQKTADSDSSEEEEEDDDDLM